MSSNDIILFGDLNSRTANLKDYVLVDEFMSHMYDNDILTSENAETLQHFESNNVPLDRNTVDTMTNAYGYQLLDFCRSNDIFIVNGRFGLDSITPKLTCKDASTVDYFLTTASIFSHISNFGVLDFSPLYSDSHSAVTLTLEIWPESSCTFQSIHQKISETPVKVKLWNRDKSEIFVENLDKSCIVNINSKLDDFIQAPSVTESNINSIINDIDALFMKSCENTFGHYAPKHKNKDKTKKPWFSAECHVARNLYHKTRRLYNKHKSDYYKSMLRNVSKNYKDTMSKHIRLHKNKTTEKLRQLKSTNPKEYWRIINSDKDKKSALAGLNDLYDYFKKVNETKIEGNVPNIDISDSMINDEINLPITANEILKAVKLLKSSKSPGVDNLLNEHIKSTINIMMPIYLKLFNLIFDSGVVPETWLVGDILPIYKKKGDAKLPENYRPITLLSCLGKLFSSIINNRLSTFAEDNKIITDSQAGFRKGFSTTDNIFIINCLIDIFKSQKKKLYCTFVDFKQAFDRVWRDGLWAKLHSYKINGKCLNIIKNIYEQSKSRITTAEGSSAFFPCNSGVRQGDNLSPFLFTIFLNDLEYYLHQHDTGIIIDYTNDDISVYLKLFVLLYADDTVIFSDSPEELQKSLHIFENYCYKWKLKINTEKTEVIIFSYGRLNKDLHFYLNNTELEILNEFRYLGVQFSRTGSFNIAKKHIAEQANKALFSLLRKIRNLSLPFDVQIDLFNKTIKPVLLYGCEVWGYGNCDIIERVHLKFLKIIFNLKRSTPSFMIYGELGITPITVDIKARLASYWSKLVENQSNKLTSVMYTIIYHMHKNNHYRSKYIESIKEIIETNGFSGFWLSQNVINSKWFSKCFEQKLKDQYIQSWSALVDSHSSGTNYRIFKDSFGTSEYLKILPNYFTKLLFSFRTRNHKLPIEIGRWKSIPYSERECQLCLKDIGDEYHYIMSCESFIQSRRKFIKPYFINNPNCLKFNQLMNEPNINQLKNVARFINVINKECRVNF